MTESQGPETARAADLSGAVMRRLGFVRAGAPGGRRRWGSLARAAAVLAVVALCIALWGARSRAERARPAVGDALRGSVVKGAGRLEAIMLGMPRPSRTSPALSAEAPAARSAPGATADGAAVRTRTY